MAVAVRGRCTQRLREFFYGGRHIAAQHGMHAFIVRHGGGVVSAANRITELRIEQRMLVICVGYIAYTAFVFYRERFRVEVILKERLLYRLLRLRIRAQQVACARKPQVLRGRLIVIIVMVAVARQRTAMGLRVGGA